MFVYVWSVHCLCSLCTSCLTVIGLRRSVSWFIQLFGMLTFHFSSIFIFPRSHTHSLSFFFCFIFRPNHSVLSLLDTSMNLSKPIALRLCMPQDFKDNEMTNIVQREMEKKEKQSNTQRETANRSKQSKLNL